jgi:tRNA(Ile)-lysidine synthase
MGPHPAVAEIRNAVRACLTGLAPGDLVLVACSGGADSLALAAALAFTAPRLHLRAGGVTVDHGLQPGSAERALAVAGRLTGLGLDPVLCTTVTVPSPAGALPPGPAGSSPAGRGDDRYPGPEAAARAARYEALDAAAEQSGAAVILLGHTLDDQAETVLLGLARGSGARSLAGMPGQRGRYRRPLLPVRRAATRAACAALDLPVWDDPHNGDPRFTRARVRHEVMPVLESVLGPGVAEALARTAGQLRDDAGLLDALADAEAGPSGGASGDGSLAADGLAGLPAAIRTRVLHRAAVAAGCPAGSLTAGHVQQLDALVTGWRGQRWVDLPGGVRGLRRDGQVRFTRTDERSGPQQEDDRGRGRPGNGPEGSADQRGAAASAGSGAREPD